MVNKNKILKTTSLNDALSALMRDFNVYAPAGKDERQFFTLLSAENLTGLNLEGLPTLPPKELLFPRSETIYSVDLNTGDVRQHSEAVQTVVFGLRPCDARSVVNLDSAFIEKDYRDSAYADKREKLTTVVLSCSETPYRTCFCDSMGGGPQDAEGADVMLTETADKTAWLVSAFTDKGREVEGIWEKAGLLTPPGQAEAAPPPSCELKAEKPDDLAEKLASSFDSPAWGPFSEACIGCGVCSFICPTCYCFDIDTEVSDGEATEFRCWDCCMFSDYSRMAGGHDPRPTKKERLRNRYLHKLSYFDERYGRTLCVGCGRCITKCPAGLDIASVVEWGGAL